VRQQLPFRSPHRRHPGPNRAQRLHEHSQLRPQPQTREHLHPPAPPFPSQRNNPLLPHSSHFHAHVQPQRISGPTPLQHPLPAAHPLRLSGHLPYPVHHTRPRLLAHQQVREQRPPLQQQEKQEPHQQRRHQVLHP